MDFQLTVLRKLMDDPEVRKKALGCVNVNHFIHKQYRYIFNKITNFPVNSIITCNVLQDVVSKDNIPDKAKGFLSSVIGEIASVPSVLTSDFDYGITALVQEARSEFYLSNIRSAVDSLMRGNVDEAELRIKQLPDNANRLRIKDDRRISARTMQNLRADTNCERFPTGFRVLDSVTGGGRKGEFWLWGAYTGEYKTTSLLNIAHNNFVLGKNIFFVSLEMDEDEIRRRLLCIHGIHMQCPISYRSVELDIYESDQQRANVARVKKDFDENPSFGDIQIWQPPLGVNIIDVGREFESCCSEIDCEIMILDYVQKLMPLKVRQRVREETNETLDASKRLAMEARGRDGVLLISGYQTSTEGRKQAEKNGYYDLWGLSETVGAGQVANVVCWSLVTDSMKKSKEVKVGLAKSRNSGIIGSHHYLVSDPDIGLLSKDPVRETPDVETNNDDFLDGSLVDND